MKKLTVVLQDASKAGVRRLSGSAASLEKAAAAAGLACYRIELRGVADKQKFLDACRSALQFPDWFGGNWDALEDSLADMSWQPAKGYVLYFHHANEFAAVAQPVLAEAVEVLASVAEFWQSRGKPFWALFGCAGPGLPAIPELVI